MALGHGLGDAGVDQGRGDACTCGSRQSTGFTSGDRPVVVGIQHVVTALDQTRCESRLGFGQHYDQRGQGFCQGPGGAGGGSDQAAGAHLVRALGRQDGQHGMEECQHFLGGGGLKREYRWPALKPALDLRRIRVAIAARQGRGERRPGRLRPFLPDCFQLQCALGSRAEPAGQPLADRRCLFNPMDQIIGIVGTHLAPKALLATCLNPPVLVRPAEWRDEDEAGIGRIERRRRRRAFAIVLVGLAGDAFALRADFPAGLTLRHVFTGRPGFGPAIPARLVDALLGREAQPHRRPVSGPDQVGQQARQAAIGLMAASPVIQFPGADPANRPARWLLRPRRGGCRRVGRIGRACRITRHPLHPGGAEANTGGVQCLPYRLGLARDRRALAALEIGHRRGGDTGGLGQCLLRPAKQAPCRAHQRGCQGGRGRGSRHGHMKYMTS